MNFQYATLEDCSEYTGLVVVIDVIRAFTSAAFAFSRGAERILPVGTVEEALEYKRGHPNALAFGEVHGLPHGEFDSGNSPTLIMKLDLTGRTIVQRTSAGTQGIVRSTRADHLVAASFVVAEATFRYIQARAPEAITFVNTGEIYNGGDEDRACIEYLQARLQGRSPDPEPFLERVRRAPDARPFFDPSRPEFPESDIEHCTSLDRFDFAMPVSREEDGLVIRKVFPPLPTL